MRQAEFNQQTTSAVVGYFARASPLLQQQTLVVVGRTIAAQGLISP